MKLIGNIIPAIKLVYALKYLRANKTEIFQARAAGAFDKERAAILASTSSWGKNVVRIFGTHVHIQGKENLPKEGPVVYVSNHQGLADIPICCCALDSIQAGFLSKSSLRKVPLYGEWILNIRSVMIERENPREALKAIDACIGLINQGFSMVVFPEGTRSKGGPIGEFKKGSLRMATKTGAPIIPITLKGSNEIFEDTGCIKQGCHVDFIIHPAIETKGLDRQAAGNLAATIETIIKETYDKL